MKKHTPQLVDEEVFTLIRDMEQEWRKFWEKEQFHAEHYFNLPAADTKLPDSLKDFQQFQSDLPRQFGGRLKSRLLENPYTVRVEPPRDTAKLRNAASDVEAVMTKGNELSYERGGVDPQSALAELVRQKLAIIHWCKFDEIYPAVPEPDYLDSVDEEQRADYGPLYRDDHEPADAESEFPYALTAGGTLDIGKEGYPRRRKLTRYRKSDEAVQRDYRASKAKAGYPWFHEAIPTNSFAAKFDRSLANGMAVVMIRRAVPVASYVRNLNTKRGAQKPGDVPPMSINEVNPDIPIYGEQDAPMWWEPNGTLVAGDRIMVYQLWTRDECYEVIGSETTGELSATGGLQVADCWQHPYEMPPFAMAYGVINEGTYDPELRYESPLEGIFRLKPTFDRAVTLMLAIGEMIALPYYYWKQIDTGQPRLNESGQIAYLTRSAADADFAPEGCELAQLPFEMNPAYKDSIALLKEMFEAAAPATGQAEFTASTQPWAIRLQTAQENIEPGRYLANIARALTVMERNKAMVMSKPVEEGGTGEVPIFARQKRGKTDRGTIISIKPEDIATLDISVVIESTTQAERITKERTGAEMYKDGLITLAEYLEDWKGEQDPDKAALALNVERIFGQYIEPTLLAQIMASIGYALGPNGTAISPQGQPTDPRAVLASKGYTPDTQRALPAPGQSSVPGQGGGPISQQVMPQQQMGDLAPLQAPGQMPMQGMAG